MIHRWVPFSARESVGSGPHSGRVGSRLPAGRVGSGLFAGQVGSGLFAGRVGSGLFAGRVGSGLFAGRVGSELFSARRVPRAALAGSVLTFALLAGACTTEAAPAPAGAADPATASEEASPFTECTALSVPPAAAAPGSVVPSAGASAAAGSVAGAALPDLELPCFTGGQPFRLVDLRGPAVINLWASWCGPCRDELPLMQRLADRTAGRLHVLGVDIGDGREAAASFGAGKQITMPTLYDRERSLPSALGRVTLPVTIFIDAAGRGYVHPRPVDARELSELVKEHSGVTVTL